MDFEKAIPVETVAGEKMQRKISHSVAIASSDHIESKRIAVASQYFTYDFLSAIDRVAVSPDWVKSSRIMGVGVKKRYKPLVGADGRLVLPSLLSKSERFKPPILEALNGMSLSSLVPQLTPMWQVSHRNASFSC